MLDRVGEGGRALGTWSWLFLTEEVFAPCTSSTSSTKLDEFCSLEGVCGRFEIHRGVDGLMEAGGEDGDSGRRNGELRGEPIERGEGLYGEID